MSINEVKTMSLEKARELITDLLDIFNMVMKLYLSWQPIRISEMNDNIRNGTVYNIIVKSSVEGAKEKNKDINNFVTFQKIGFIVNRELKKVYKFDKKNGKIFKVDYLEDVFIENNLITVLFKNRIFEIRFFDSPEEIGCISGLDHYDDETYTCVEFCEKRYDGTLKYTMTFGIDIEKKKLVELFGVAHFNKVNITRSPSEKDILKIEKELYGKSMF